MPWFTLTNYETLGDGEPVLSEIMIFEATDEATAIREGRHHCRLAGKEDFAVLVGPNYQRLHFYHRFDA